MSEAQQQQKQSLYHTSTSNHLDLRKAAQHERLNLYHPKAETGNQVCSGDTASGTDFGSRLSPIHERPVTKKSTGYVGVGGSEFCTVDGM